MAAQKLGVSRAVGVPEDIYIFFRLLLKNVSQFTVFFQGPKFFNSGITNSPSDVKFI